MHLRTSRTVADPYDSPSESSGLADILEIATAIEEKATSVRSERTRTGTAAVPLAPQMAPAMALSTSRSFGSDWEDDPEPLLTSGAQATARRSPAILWGAIGGLAVVVLGGSIAWMRRPPPDPAAPVAQAAAVEVDRAPEHPAQGSVAQGSIEQSSIAQGSIAQGSIARTQDADATAITAPPETPAVSPSLAAPADAARLPDAPPVPQVTKVTKVAPSSQKPTSSRGSRASASKSTEKANTASVPPAPAVEPAQKFSTECILDPSMEGCSAAKAASSASPKPTINVDASLPDKLTQTQLRDGIEPMKGKAKACGDKYGAAAGTTVRIKLSVSGANGRITSATALSPHDSQPLGQCVAEALKAATFPRFKSTAQGTIFPVKI